MGSVKVRIRRDHLRFKPYPHLKSRFFQSAAKALQSLRDLFPVAPPVSKGTVILLPSSEPAVIHDEHTDTGLLRPESEFNELIGIKIKISCPPVVYQDRALLTYITVPHDVIPGEVVKAPAHMSDPPGRKAESQLRRTERFPGFQGPLKSVIGYSRHDTHAVKLRPLDL